MTLEVFISMGGYSQYVWGTFGSGLILYGALMLHALKRYHSKKKH